MTLLPLVSRSEDVGAKPAQKKNHIEFVISNWGKSTVSSIATPMAKYRKQVYDAISLRWNYYLRDKMDSVAFGSARISFVVDENGHVSGIQVDSNTSNKSLADISMRAIRDAEIGAPPSDPGSPVSAPLDWTLTFTYYPSPAPTKKPEGAPKQ